MKYAQKDALGYRWRFRGHLVILIVGSVLGAAGCGGSDSTPIATPAEATDVADPASSQTSPPPGGMELPNNFDVDDQDVSDVSTEPAGSGTSFELPE